jgi:hypothetical protein
LSFAIEELLRPEAFPHPVTGIELIETHVSWVVLTGPYAYKIKRAVVFDFIDSSTLERRHHLCDEELRLNKRLAPELYVDIVPIGRTDQGLRVGGTANVIEYAVRMVEFDRAQELSALLEGRTVYAGEIGELAHTLAAFHAAAPVAPAESPFGGYESIFSGVTENLSALTSRADLATGGQPPRWLSKWLSDAFEKARGRIQARKADGFIRECHGDLHARNIVRWRARLVPFDCLEFNPAMRWIDVACEIAFLYMDLRGYGREDLAYVFLSEYLQASGDYPALGVLRIYAAHLALVRAKVDVIQAGSAHGPAAAAARERIGHRLALAAAIAGKPDPALVIMSGVSGSGKSWLSERMVPAFRAVRIRSDVERKRLAGVETLARTASETGGGIYTGGLTALTYDRIFASAEEGILAGYSVIVDATFLQSRQRERFLDLARRAHCRAVVVRCTAPPGILQARIAVRDAAGRDPSEADAAVLARQLQAVEDLTPREAAHAVAIDTGSLASADDAIARVAQALASGPAT